MNLLWERLSRLVSTLAQPDNMNNYGIDLIEVDVGITPFERKKQLLGVRYELACTNKSDSAVVLNLFPSASAVNIVDTKYRENRVGLAAILSWFTVGLNASYNRDHLQMSQALGQSAYITGYGVGTSDFGSISGAIWGTTRFPPEIAHFCVGRRSEFLYHLLRDREEGRVVQKRYERLVCKRSQASRE